MRINFNMIAKRRIIKKHKDIIRESMLFDNNYYIKMYNLSKRVDAVEHFCTIGWHKGLNPSEFFDTFFYLETYEDVRRAGVNPLVHYLTEGARELRSPSPNFDVRAFCAAHREPHQIIENPAELCISQYGSYDWQDERPTVTALPTDVIEEFKPYFDEGYYISINADALSSSVDAYNHFIMHGQHENRDPSANFDIEYYRRKIRGSYKLLSNPIYHYIRLGKAQGVKTQPVNAIHIDPHRAQKSTDAMPLRVCVHTHCFYPELVSEFVPGFLSFPDATRFVVTVISEADRHFVRRVCEQANLPGTCEVRVVPNKGRDLAPFLIGCQDIWRDYDLVLHIHTKSSPHVSWGDQWRRYLFDQTMGSKALVETIIDLFARESDIGCLYPRNFCRIRGYLQKESNSQIIGAILNRLGFQDAVEVKSDYPAGSMAWYRTKALAPLIEVFGKLDLFEDETNQEDGTFAHALERALPLTAKAGGYRVLSYTTPLRTRLPRLTGFPEREGSRAAVPERWYRNTPRIARQAPRTLAPLNVAYNPRHLDIHWIVPSFGPSAGGHMTIFRIIELLERFGHRQTIWVQNAEFIVDEAQAAQRIRQWYRPLGTRVHVRFLPEDVRELAGDILIATDCWTAYPAVQAQNFKERFYFIQDYEPSFHPAGELQLMAEGTYDLGLAALCAGSWLHQLMTERGLWSRSWDLCADHDVYYPGVQREFDEQPVRIAFYARPYTPRRAVTLGFVALETLHRRGVKFHVDLFGEADLKIAFTFPHTQYGILTPAQLGDLYRSSDIGVVFSTTNYSLIPLEMMASGLPVVEIDTPSTRAVFKNGEVSFAKPTPYEIADAIETLIKDPDLRERQRAQGRAFVTRTSWENSAKAVEAGVLERLAELGYRSVDPATVMSTGVITQRKAAVFIPTYNAGPSFERVLDSVTRQACDFAYDILIIDSQSTDGTPELARRYAGKGVRVETIAKAEFQHGRTRNLGIEHADGDYVAVITQDACPKNERWLAALVGGFAHGPRVAGVIGRHEAYPEHDLFTRRDMREMFDGLALLPPLIDRDIGLPSYIYPSGRTWRMLTQFYSDNNSAISREAWKILPYPEIDWGEDQVWADEMLRLGFQKAYVDEAVVYHSHGFDLAEHYTTSMTEGRFWGQRFGFDLHPDPEAAIAAMNDRDRAYAVHESVGSATLRQRQLINRATVEGRTAGYLASLQD